MDGKWKSVGTTNVYKGDAISLTVVDAQLPDGSHQDYPVVERVDVHGSTYVLVNVAGKGVLMVWRHRLINDTWSWELPGGVVKSTERAVKAAPGLVLEQTGWELSDVEALVTFQPLIDLVESECEIFTATSAEWKGEDDANDAGDLAWIARKIFPRCSTRARFTTGQRLRGSWPPSAKA